MCSAVDSYDNPTPSNGSTNPSPSSDGRYPVGSTVTFLCDPGYTAMGNTNSVCQEDLAWSHQPPICKPGRKMIIAVKFKRNIFSF